MRGVLLALAVLGAPPGSREQAVELRRGDRVVVEVASGSVRVEGWDRAVAALGEGPAGSEVTLVRDGSRIVVQPVQGKGRERSVEVLLRLPAWADVEVRGRSLDVDVAGMASQVQVATVVGDVRARDTSGGLTLTTVQGEVHVRNARGRISVRSRGDDVTLVSVEGTVEASAGSGDVRLEGVRSASVRAETLDGDLYFQGPLAAGGSYRFSVHSGDAEIVVPAGTGAQVRVSTFDGELHSDFPVTLRRYGGGGMFDFTLGDGSAGLEVQVFDGDIRLLSGGR